MPKTNQRRRRRSAAERAAIVKRFRASGLSASAFSRREGIALSSLERWRRQSVSVSDTPFVELTSSPERSDSGDSWSLEIALPGGVELRLRG